ncbi:CehA/McbA family metallohydrolase [bacterium]|nr:CehA/McbA family metallohydrolase [bacterium]
MLTVHLRVNDAATGRPTPVRLRVSGPDGTNYAPLGRFTDFPAGVNEDVGGGLRLGREAWFTIDGGCEILLPAGVPLRVQATKGPEYHPLDATVTLGAGQLALRFAVERWHDRRADGWVSGDGRCHFLPPHAALLDAAAEDVDVVNLLAAVQPYPSIDGTAYRTVPHLAAFSGQGAALEATGRLVAVNTLNAHPALGTVALLHSHRPVFPLTFGGEDADDWGVCDWCDQCHRKGGLVVWAEAFQRHAGLVGGEALVAALLGKVDAIEVTGGTRSAVLPWVYRLWTSGFPIPLVGASGKDSNRVPLGAVRTYAKPDPTEPNRYKGWVEAVRAGGSFVSAGPLVGLSVEGGRARVSARSLARTDALELLADGDVIARAGVTRDGATFVAELDVPVPSAGWLAARCVPTGSAGFAHTSPVRLGPSDRSGDAATALRPLVEATREWAEVAGRYENPRRKQALLDRCADALARLAGRS